MSRKECPITEGSIAPKFELPDKNGKKRRLGAEKPSLTVLYFYPKDNTPGCTVEAMEFTALLKEFKKRGASIIGISGGDEVSKQKFCDKHNLQVLLLSDTDFTVSKQYGVYGDKKFMGRTVRGIKRTTFLLDSRLRVLKIFSNVRAKGHAEAVLDFLDQLKE
jgi:peroxiredoxin Q/BCP